MDYIISGIQQVGIGNSNVHEAFKWYRQNFGMDIPILDENSEANQMLPYTAGKPHQRHAILAINLKGGGGFEIWQYVSRKPEPAAFKIELGDLGFTIAKMKCDNVQTAFDFLKKKDVKLLSGIEKDPIGNEHFYLEDLYGNLFEVVKGNDWFSEGIFPTGGPSGMVIGVSDIERSKKFYADILGYDAVIFDEEKAFSDLSSLPGGDKAMRRVLLTHSKPRAGSFSKLLGSSTIELVKVNDRQPRKIFENRLWGDLGFIHLCFDIKDMKALKEHCAATGYPFTVESNPDFDMGDVWTICLHRGPGRCSHRICRDTQDTGDKENKLVFGSGQKRPQEGVALLDVKGFKVQPGKGLKKVAINILASLVFLLAFPFYSWAIPDSLVYRINDREGLGINYNGGSLNFSLDHENYDYWFFSKTDSYKNALKNTYDSDWMRLKSDLRSDEDSVFKGFGWFRLHYKAGKTHVGKVLMLRIAHFGASEIFNDGKLITVNGLVSPNVEHEIGVDPRMEFAPLYIADTLEHVLAVRYSNMRYSYYSDKFSTDLIGFALKLLTYDESFEMIALSEGQSIYFVAIAFFLMALAVVHLMIYLFERSRSFNLYHALFVLSLAFVFLFPIINRHITVPLTEFRINYYTGFLVPTFLMMEFALLYNLFQRRYNKYFYISLVCYVGALVMSYVFDNYSGFFYIILFFNVYIGSTILSVKAIRRIFAARKLLASVFWALRYSSYWQYWHWYYLTMTDCSRLYFWRYLAYCASHFP